MSGSAPAPEQQPVIPVSLVDRTAKERSSHCRLEGSATRGLYERIQPGRTVVFKSARLLTMRGAEELPSHDVVVRDGRIEHVRPSGGTVAADAIVIEANGRTLMPGLADMHGHLLVASWAQAMGAQVPGGGDGSQYMLPYDLQLFQLLANGITRLEVMAGCPDALWMRDSIRSGALVGPRMRVGSPLIDGAPNLHSDLMSYIVGDRQGGMGAGELLADMGFDFAKPYTNLPAEGYEGLLEVCHRRGIRVMGHVPTAIGAEKAIQMGQHGIAHASELFMDVDGDKRLDPARRDRIVALMSDSGTWLQTTIGLVSVYEWLVGRRPLRAPDESWASPLQKMIADESGPLVVMTRSNDWLKSKLDRIYGLSCEYTAMAHRAGVRLLPGTDFPNPYIVPGFSLHDELQLLTQQCGLLPREALHAATRHAAQYQGAGPSDGFVTEGGLGDLILLNDDPLSDIKGTRSIETVLIGSNLLRRASIDDGLARIARAYAAMPVVSMEPMAPMAPMEPKRDRA